MLCSELTTRYIGLAFAGSGQKLTSQCICVTTEHLRIGLARDTDQAKSTIARCYYVSRVFEGDKASRI